MMKGRCGGCTRLAYNEGVKGSTGNVGADYSVKLEDVKQDTLL